MSALISRLWRWWSGEALALLPPTWRRQGEEWLVLWHDGAASFWRRRGDQAEAVARPPDGTALTLRLADEKIWRRALTLPRAAGPFLRQILQNEMDRRTPWRAEQVYFDVASRPDPADRGQLAVTLTVLPRDRAAAALAALAADGWSVERIELQDGADAGRAGPQVTLSGGETVGGGRHPWPGRVLAAALILATLSLAGQTLWQAVTAAQLAAARDQATATRRLAGDIAAQQRRQHFPSRRRQESLPAIALLDRLARALPDDCWAEQIDIAADGVTVAGIAAEPARLLAALQSQGFAGAEFRAAVTPAPGGGQKFVLHAGLPEVAHGAP